MVLNAKEKKASLEWNIYLYIYIYYIFCLVEFCRYSLETL